MKGMDEVNEGLDRMLRMMRNEGMFNECLKGQSVVFRC